MKKYIIGLGCSWTAGEGGWTEDIFNQYPEGRVQISLRGKSDYHLRKMEHENSWVNVLCRDHFPEYTPVNLGIKGIGNYAAVHQLHFCDRIDFSRSTGIIILLLSGFERFDVLHQNISYDFHQNDGEDDGYNNNSYKHYKWRTLWPYEQEKGKGDPAWSCYARDLWSEQFVANHQLISILDLQTFAKAYNFNLVIANAFNQRKEGVIPYLKTYASGLYDKINWGDYLHNTVDYSAFMEKLVDLDGKLERKDWGAYYDFYRNLSWPSTYLTNCDGAHPTIKGYKVIASELANFIKYKNYVQENNKFCKP